MEIRRDIFQAIADPTRRAIIHRLTEEPLNLKTLSTHFKVSRPAVSRHIKILTECGVVVITEKGRERFCMTDLNKLKEIDQWLSYYRKFWNRKLDALADFLDSNTDNEF